jgi:hypothetical protein
MSRFEVKLFKDKRKYANDNSPYIDIKMPSGTIQVNRQSLIDNTNLSLHTGCFGYDDQKGKIYIEVAVKMLNNGSLTIIYDPRVNTADSVAFQIISMYNVCKIFHIKNISEKFASSIIKCEYDIILACIRYISIATDQELYMELIDQLYDIKLDVYEISSQCRVITRNTISKYSDQELRTAIFLLLMLSNENKTDTVRRLTLI